MQILKQMWLLELGRSALDKALEHQTDLAQPYILILFGLGGNIGTVCAFGRTKSLLRKP